MITDAKLYRIFNNKFFTELSDKISIELSDELSEEFGRELNLGFINKNFIEKKIFKKNLSLLFRTAVKKFFYKKEGSRFLYKTRRMGPPK